MTFPVKWYSSGMQGAPALANTAGALNTVLKAVLVNGFGNTTPSSIIYSSGLSTITITFPTTHAFLVDSIIEISGANESGFNGEYRVNSITTTTVVVGLDNGTPLATSATGTLVVKYPALGGWAIEFEDVVNYKIVIKRTSASSTPIRLIIDNSAYTGWNTSNAYYAKVFMAEDVTGVNTYTTVLQHAWPCGIYGATSPDWHIIGDSLIFYFINKFANQNRRAVHAFGDIVSVRPGDNYHCLLCTSERTVGATDNEWGGTTEYTYNKFLAFGVNTSKYLARSYHQIFGVVSCLWWGYKTYIGEGLSFPNPSDNGFYVSTDKIPVLDDLSLRGYLPGVVVPYQVVSAYDGINLKNLPNIPNKIIRLLLASRDSYNTTGNGLIGFDVTGPWR